MLNPTYAKFMNEVESLIQNLSGDELREIIMNLAEHQHISERHEFLQFLKQNVPTTRLLEELEDESELSSTEFLNQIKEFKQRILDGEFFDEEENYRAYEMEERSSWGSDYYDEEIDFENEEYVGEMAELLDVAKQFFRKQDIPTASEAYEMLFEIIENSEYYDDAEYFIYGFSFEEVLEDDFLKEHKTLHLRCKYLRSIETDDFQSVYPAITIKKNINLTDIIEIDRNPLPALDQFIEGFIEFLEANPQNDRHLIDALFVKGGMDEIKCFAYSHGSQHPPVFLYYYDYAKENNFPQKHLLKLIFDGLDIIPIKYCTREYLSRELIQIAKSTNDKKHLLIGLSTAFSSNPTLKNLAFYLDFIECKNNVDEMNKLKDYFQKEDLTKYSSDDYYSFHHDFEQHDIFSLKTSNLSIKTLIIGRYLLEGIEPLLNLIDPQKYLGFSGRQNYVAITCALALKTIAQSTNGVVIDALLNHYCLDKSSEAFFTLKNMISNKAKIDSLPQKKCLNTLERIENLAVNRVTYILENKRRGGYDSACLLLVACAETRQLVTNDGDKLIREIDEEFKRFRAFRSTLKSLTAQSKLLRAVT